MSSDGTDQNENRDNDEKIFESIKITFQSIVAAGLTKASVNKVGNTAEVGVNSEKAKMSQNKVNDAPRAKKLKVNNETKNKKIKVNNEAKAGNVNYNYPYDFNVNHNYPLYFNTNQSFIPKKRSPAEISDKKTKEAISFEILSASPGLFCNYIENIMQPSRPQENAHNGNEHIGKYDSHKKKFSCLDYLRPNHIPIHFNVDHIGNRHFDPNYNNLNDKPTNFNINNYHSFANFNHHMYTLNQEMEYNNINESIQNSFERNKNANKELFDLLGRPGNHKIAQDYPIPSNRAKFYDFTGKSALERCYLSAIEDINKVNDKRNIKKQPSSISMNSQNPVVNIEPVLIQTMSNVEVHKHYIKNLYSSTWPLEKKVTHVNQKLILKLKMPRKILDVNGSEIYPLQKSNFKKDEVIPDKKIEDKIIIPPYKHFFIKIKAFKSDRIYDDQKALS